MSKNRYPVSVLLLVMICGLLVPVAQAQKTTAWSGAGADNLWTTAANWTNNVPTDGVLDKVFITGTEGSPFIVNLNGATARNVSLNTVTINYATITNGQWDWNSQGALYATNVVFTDSAKIKLLPPLVTLSNVTYNRTGGSDNNFGMAGGDATHRYLGGYIRTKGLSLSPSYGWSVVQTILIEGYGGPGGGLHSAAYYLEIGYKSAANGQSFLRLQDTRLQTTSGYIGWDGGANQGTGQSTLTMTNSLLRLEGRLLLNTNAIFKAASSELEFRAIYNDITLFGLRNRMTNSFLFDGEGLTVGAYSDNAGMQFEVSGTDTGAVFSGFHDNYSIDQLKIGLRDSGNTTPKIVFTNAYDNDGLAGNESLYVDVITEIDNTSKVGVDPTFTLNLNGLNVFYKKYVDSTNVPMAVANGTLTQVTGASFFAASGYIHAVEGAKTFVKSDSPVAIGADYGSVYVSGFAAGKPLNAKLVVSGTQPNIDALRTELNATGSGSQMTISYPQGSNGGTMFFDWNFSHRSVSLTSLEVSEKANGTLLVIR